METENLKQVFFLSMQNYKQFYDPLPYYETVLIELISTHDSDFALGIRN